MPNPNNLILIDANGKAALASDDAWQFVRLPVIEEEVKKQAGKVVLFKLTGAESASAEQIANIEIPAGKVMLPLPVWLARKAEFAARLAAGEIGVWLDAYERVELLVEAQADLKVFPVIGVYTERFADGRIYSTAALLRTRYGFTGQLRALGDVLRDQAYLMMRCGFTALQIRADRSAAEAVASVNDFSEPYQGSVTINQPLWRRHARA